MRAAPAANDRGQVARLLDKHDLGVCYPSALPGGVPAKACDAQDSGRALEIAREVLRFVRERLATPSA